jgi:hypothetical protein
LGNIKLVGVVISSEGTFDLTIDGAAVTHISQAALFPSSNWAGLAVSKMTGYGLDGWGLNPGRNIANRFLLCHVPNGSEAYMVLCSVGIGAVCLSERPPERETHSYIHLCLLAMYEVLSLRPLPAFLA